MWPRPHLQCSRTARSAILVRILLISFRFLLLTPMNHYTVSENERQLPTRDAPTTSSCNGAATRQDCNPGAFFTHFTSFFITNTYQIIVQCPKALCSRKHAMQLHPCPATGTQCSRTMHSTIVVCILYISFRFLLLTSNICYKASGTRMELQTHDAPSGSSHNRAATHQDHIPSNPSA